MTRRPSAHPAPGRTGAGSTAEPAEPAATGRRPVRERLLAAADELFYREGINNVGIDRVLEHAGVAKASLYTTFGSKEELVRAYLEGRQQARRARVEAAIARHEEPRGQLLAIFDVASEMLASPAFRGCAFLMASSELPAGGRTRPVCDAYRQWLRELLQRLAAEAGARDPAQLARQLSLLYDGALVSAQMDGDAGAAAAAKETAASLLDAALPRAKAR
jgi:AcrR family transcriptional regulator